MVNYFEEENDYGINDYGMDALVTLENQAHSAVSTLRGLRSGDLLGDTGLAIQLQLMRGLSIRVSEALEETAVLMLHMQEFERPSVNSVARNAGVSVSTVKKWMDRATPYPDLDDDGNPV